ncbi:L-type lectin-domain containing receptor kinase IX.1 [Morella rubra]|uniref:L-type lectin-domain containing receptor kinase IX.1 n=1 Tax=Morella rubra TaxID=262757 RepID=A0A6A1VTS1_9ROSI|nr:L-type lectin-domain containing receptor kinase IX.1 [Morella rubra]
MISASPTNGFRVGWAIYAEKVPLWENDAAKFTDFSTHFSFSIDTQGNTHYADGLVFFIAPAGFENIPPNSAGKYLGLFNTTTVPSHGDQIVLVEFDSFVNIEWDPGFEHVGINSNSLVSATSTPWNASLHSGDIADVWITYNASTKNLSVSWKYQKTSNTRENTSLSYEIDLIKVLPQWATVGFSAATGLFGERNSLRSWEFNSSLETKDPYGNNAEKKVLPVGVTVPGGVLIAGAVFFLIAGAVIAFIILWTWKRKKSTITTAKTVNTTSTNHDDIIRGAGPRRFSYEDLATATNNFSNDRKLGQGGFGAVYRGYLSDLDIVVAVKKISKGSRQGRKEYITEVKIFSRLRHRNLVKLIGWCHDRSEFLIVYEFMPNSSLDFHLFGKRRPLPWAVRYKVATGLASALLYLHDEWEQCVVHRDIKASNIMLDSSFNVKLGDFGLARLVDHELGPQTTGVAGTFGYMAPEYVVTGRASKESDVYSYGVVALEIATGRKATDPPDNTSGMGLVEWIWKLYDSGSLSRAIDEKLHPDFDEKQAECLMITGLWCAHPDRSLRPSIRQAIHLLDHFEGPMPNIPTKMPVPLYQVVPTPLEINSGPSITTSLEEGR